MAEMHKSPCNMFGILREQGPSTPIHPDQSTIPAIAGADPDNVTSERVQALTTKVDQLELDLSWALLDNERMRRRLQHHENRARDTAAQERQREQHKLLIQRLRRQREDARLELRKLSDQRAARDEEIKTLTTRIATSAVQAQETSRLTGTLKNELDAARKAMDELKMDREWAYQEIEVQRCRAEGNMCQAVELSKQKRVLREAHASVLAKLYDLGDKMRAGRGISPGELAGVRAGKVQAETEVYRLRTLIGTFGIDPATGRTVQGRDPCRFSTAEYLVNVAAKTNLASEAEGLKAELEALRRMLRGGPEGDELAEMVRRNVVLEQTVKTREEEILRLEERIGYANEVLDPAHATTEAVRKQSPEPSGRGKQGSSARSKVADGETLDDGKDTEKNIAQQRKSLASGRGMRLVFVTIVYLLAAYRYL
ncbi:hypothetical protein CAC42_555 [Sphaceloma murrayae]|uniref:Uncharacterized protein n=1 Tax=Sphaceloma murrayae TaxID=2082308 RepID=A0A2K1R3U9_9PEZI|nr:hypothetical protein CAC42_555 [Sphaceloma murrayae]